jgi:DNA polymerase-3 subunit delta'
MPGSLMTTATIDNWGLTGHRWAVDLLRRHVANGEARHAYLFAGPPGVGRRTLALRFARALNCTNPPAPGEFCGTCRDCRQIEAMQHPDLSVVQAEYQGGVLKVDQVRSVQHMLSLRPYQSAYRVALFLRFQEANASAQNALLKTLEEAPPYAILLLTADAPEQLLPTIVSRCEVMRLRPSNADEVQSMLVGSGVESARAGMIGHISAGRPGYAARLVSEPGLLKARQERLEEMNRLLRSTRVEKFAHALVLAKDKDAMRQALTFWLSFWRDVMLKAADASVPIANVDYGPQIEELASRLGFEAACRIVRDLELGIQRLERNINARLLAEVLLLGWPKV